MGQIRLDITSDGESRELKEGFAIDKHILIVRALSTVRIIPEFFGRLFCVVLTVKFMNLFCQFRVWTFHNSIADNLLDG